MGKYSAAKMNGAQDKKFQNAYNTLIDLLETGYVSESMLGGHKARVSVDPKGGLQIIIDDVSKFFVGQDGRVYATSIGNAEGGYAEVGVHTTHGGGFGMDLFKDNILFCSIDVLSDGGFALYDKNDAQRIAMSTSQTRITDETGKIIFSSDRTTDGGYSRICCPTVNNEIGVDSIGVYKIISGGAKAYL